MKLAFWKGKRSRRRAAGAATGADTAIDPADADPDEAARAAHDLRVRTRRRLIGAFALLLAVVVLVPMLLDPSPRALPDNIPIELPSDRTPFTPKLAPPVAEPAVPTEGAIPVPAAPGSAADAAAVAADAPAAPTPSKPPEAGSNHKHGAAADAGKAPARKAEPHADAKAAAGRIFVQAAALAKQSAAQELAGRLSRSGLAPFVERAETSDGVRYRVRLGPFSTRGEAERSRARLRALGVSANIVGA